MSARTKPTMSDLLNQAADLISPEGCWTPLGTRNGGHHPYDVLHEEAHAWSGICAVYHVHDKVSFGGSAPMLRYLDDAVGTYFGSWEKRKGRKSSEVVAAIRRAAAIAATDDLQDVAA